jgi:hypothetical protein
MKITGGVVRQRPENVHYQGGTDPELSVYRSHTVALLRRYFRMSIELGRLPTVLGREFFRAKVTSYRMHSFEDVVILVHDVESCLGRLDVTSQQVVARIIFQEHTYEEAAAIMGWTRKTLAVNASAALDRLSEMFLQHGLLQPFGFAKKTPAKSCQEGKTGEIDASV